MTRDEIQDIEIQLVLEALRLRYGYDFRHYVPASLKRRVLHCLVSCGMESVSDIIPRLLYEGAFLERLIGVLTIAVTTLFRDPLVFRSLRELSVPMLRTQPFLNVWSAGCATGEEVYAIAILLREEGLYERSRIYATDLNLESLKIAEAGIYEADRWPEFAQNYQTAGGRGRLSDHCRVEGEMVRMDPDLKRHVVFSGHNLANDGAFAEMHLIVCRNVLIYFDPALQKRVLGLFLDSLVRGGDLCLGSSESVDDPGVISHFKVLSSAHRLFRADFKGRARR